MAGDNDMRSTQFWVYKIWQALTNNGANTTGASIAGAGTGGALVVEQRTYATVLSGELAGSVTAAQMPQRACKLVKFVALPDNAGNVYIGGASVTVAGGTTDTTSGLVLDAGQDSGWIPIADMNQLFRICDNAGDDLTYIALL